MHKVMPYKMQVSSVKMLLSKNYKIEPDLIDIESEIDATLTFTENWEHIFDKYIRPKLKEHYHENVITK